MAAAVTVFGVMNGAGAAGAAATVLIATGALVAVFGHVGYGAGRLARRAFGGGKRCCLAPPQNRP